MTARNRRSMLAFIALAPLPMPERFTYRYNDEARDWHVDIVTAGVDDAQAWCRRFGLDDQAKADYVPAADPTVHRYAWWGDWEGWRVTIDADVREEAVDLPADTAERLAALAAGEVAEPTPEPLRRLEGPQ